ncbi:MAG: hypothetical protein DHS20C16_27530 [Phycisphaerae bacterium]|nr:MAG: hypothetical protein DHS20C16_27530 [Phycisphaerae bacterium]
MAKLSVVHGRESDGKLDTFGVSGFVYKDVFLIFDHQTESLWYPLDDEKWTAVSGKRKGETISFLAEPAPMPLGEWRKIHPKTKVLLASKSKFDKD